MNSILYIGVDGGGTNTSFLLINDKGEILSYWNDDSCHYMQKSLEELKEILYRGVCKLCKNANSTIADIDFAFFGLPGYGEDKEMANILDNLIHEIMKGDNYFCANDAEAGWAGSLACKPGINIVAGTGAIGFGKDYSGNSARASGWGYFCGDEGSAYWIAKKMISLFFKESDGRKEKAALYSIIYDKYNLNRDAEFISTIYNDIGRERDNIASLAPIVTEAVKQGDSSAEKILEEAAYEHSLTVHALLKKLDFNSEAIDVSYSGGVFNAGALILGPFKKYLFDLNENINLKTPKLLPISGAALYAYKIHNRRTNSNFYQKKYDRVLNKLQRQEKIFISS